MEIATCMDVAMTSWFRGTEHDNMEVERILNFEVEVNSNFEDRPINYIPLLWPEVSQPQYILILNSLKSTAGQSRVNWGLNK